MPRLGRVPSFFPGAALQATKIEAPSCQGVQTGLEADKRFCLGMCLFIWLQKLTGTTEYYTSCFSKVARWSHSWT